MFARLLCAVAGHRYTVERRLSAEARKVRCPRCGQAWAMHDWLEVILPWDADFEALYAPGGLLHPPGAKPKEGETT